MFERFTDNARTVVILAKAKATERGDQIRPVYMLHNYIGTEHLLLGLLTAAERNPREGFTPETAEALPGLGIDPAQARQRVLDELRHVPA